MVIAKKKKNKNTPALPPEELERRAHRKEIRDIFRIAGFARVTGISDKEFTFKSRRGELDDVFIFENLVVLLEYTTAKSSNASGHLTKKKLIFDRILVNKVEFIDFFEEMFDTFKTARGSFFTAEQCQVIIVYASKNSMDSEHKALQPEVVFLDYPVVKYFGSIVGSVKMSARFELFAFLRLEEDQIGETSIKPSAPMEGYDGTLLPESHSNFPPGYKLVSFYIDPEALLRKSYVLRRQGWRDESDLYQRMITSKKVNAIRRYLNENDRVFVNNIIVTFPSNTKLLDENGDTVNPSRLTKTAPVKIQIPSGFNVIGLIDGQHRVFAYHEGGEFEEKIERLRKMQNLLATGIVYPTGLSSVDRKKFESQLFLEINSTQANASSELKQAIGLMLKPFSSESIAKALINKLNSKGPLENQFEVRFYETDKIKTTSIVSYGLRPLVKLSGTDSFFSLWKEPGKKELLNESDLELLEKYISFCATQLNTFLGAVRTNADSSQWTADKSVKNKILSTTSINGLVICFRRLIEEGKTGSSSDYNEKLKKISTFDFAAFKSSQYGAMSRDLHDKFFK
jgi:DGQHR domain-containing protein